MSVTSAVRHGAYRRTSSLVLTWAATIFAVAIATFGIGHTLVAASLRLRDGQFGAVAEYVVFLLVVLLLSYGTFTYLLARIGFIRRMAALGTHGGDADDPGIDETLPTITVLVPSYCEDVNVVRMTLLSAALQDYPSLRVVLLIDDPPNPSAPEQIDALHAARCLPDALRSMLAAPAAECRAALESYVQRARAGSVEPAAEARRLADLNDRVASWFEGWAEQHPQGDHTERFFVALTYRAPARRYRRHAAQLRAQAAPVDDGLLHEYRRLAHLFQAEISTFERKRYANLSHAANKASNLNSYIGLLGNRYRSVAGADGLLLAPAAPSDADLDVPDSECVLLLDADTLIAPDYARRLARSLQAPGNANVAVAQCPYTAFPEAPGELQRIAGAQTDVQFLLHQGMARYDAAYWVGANALVRTAALRQIATVAVERGHRITKFIQDNTLIEDTESSLDLIQRGWRIHNHPERLAFSATPADFGALIIQRRRWANGGLLLLPKLLRYLAAGWRQWDRIREVFLRAHYLLAMGPVSIAILVILLFTFDASIRTHWIFVIACVYFGFYMRDLNLNGYPHADLLRVFALNLLLVPINLGGLAQSVRQALTGRKPRFGRTPKAGSRTAVAPGYVFAEVFGLFALGALAVRDFAGDHPLHGAILALHAAFFVYALVTYLGVRAACADVVAGLPRPQLPPAGVGAHQRDLGT